MAFPVTPILDDFNRSAEGPPPSSSWVTSLAPGLAILVNTCGSTDPSAGGATWNTVFSNYQECHVTLSVMAAVSSYANLYVRLQTANSYISDHYEVNFNNITGLNNDTVAFWKLVGAVFTQLGADVALGVDIAAGDRAGIRISGSTIEAFLNEVSIGSRTDGDIVATGYIGVQAIDNTTRFDNFGGGGILSSPFESPIAPRRNTLIRM